MLRIAGAAAGVAADDVGYSTMSALTVASFLDLIVMATASQSQIIEPIEWRRAG